MKSTLFTTLLILAIISIVATFGFVTSHQQATTLRQPYQPPVNAPEKPRVAGAGVVESASQNLRLGTFVPGIVTGVSVVPGQQVVAGQLLFEIDARTANARVDVQTAAVQVALAQLDALKAQPRAEDIPIAESAVAAAKAMLVQQENSLQRQRKLQQSNASSIEELDAAIEATDVAREQLRTAQAQLDKLNAGTWQPDLDAAAAQLRQANAALDQAKVELDQYHVAAPINGEILQVNLRVGEYVSASADGLIVMGDTSKLNVRVDIDEVDIPRFKTGGPAIGYRRGDTKHPISLSMLRIEPLVIPKQTLTGENQERTDTRVLQALFRVADSESPREIYVGQQLDVFITDVQ
jgi:multidrug efflux pump subunit AcrA (membrane-fusion protein)